MWLVTKRWRGNPPAGGPAGSPARLQAGPGRGGPGPPTWGLPAGWVGARRRLLVGLVGLVALAGCGGNQSGSGGGGGGAASTTSGPAGAAMVKAASSKLGMILVDGGGRTLYLFEKDQPNQSACAGACAAAWPVDHSSGPPKAGSGVKAALLGTIKRGDGTTQVTYNHHPLYYYSGDSGPGQQTGQGLNAFGAEWYVVSPAGAKVEEG
jgi:predicted lipoprotein with Yx(FWY)xxD motif